MNYPDSIDSDLPVLVIGAAGMDMVGRLNTDLSPHTSTPANIRLSYGGAARNVAENLLHLGTQVIFLSIVGNDESGRQLVKSLQEQGADVEGVMQSTVYPTGTYLAVINNNGKLEYALDDMRVLEEISPQYIEQRDDLFKQASLLFIDANLSKETLRAVMTAARRARLPVCADPTSQVLAGRLVPHLKQLQLVVPNAGEASILCKRKTGPTTQNSAIEAAKRLVSLGVEIAIVTMAEKGVCYATSQTSGFVPPVLTEIVDPTGGGDALTAGVLFGLLNQMPVDDAVRLGVAAEALTLAYPGTVIPDLSLEKLYDRLG